MFRPGDGWEPLCRFLGLPVPDQPYPRSNERAEFQAMIRKQKIFGYFTVFVAMPTLLAALAAGVAWKLEYVKF